jgi:motility quorum-sensing regulator/GCU-specific mRNA interferase toxin
MENHTAHCKLEHVKALIAANKVRATISAANCASGVGVHNLQEMYNVIASLTRSDFYKSMTTHADHRIWQDVYHAAVNGYSVYVKLTVVDDLLIVRFKEK